MFGCRWLLAVSLSVCASVSGAGNDGGLNDPWEGYNRAMFAFNDGADRYLLKPLAKGYRAITPDMVEPHVANVFSNVGEIGNIVNDGLQWKWQQAANDTGRLLINSTLGLVGLFDVAQHWGMPAADGEDFGQTLAAWGVGQGPYVVLPILGPSTLRALSGLPVDIQLDPVSHIEHVPTRNSVRGTDTLVARAALLKAEKLLSGDKYSFIRDAYLQRRQYLLNDGVVEDDFGADEDDYDDEDFYAD